MCWDHAREHVEEAAKVLAASTGTLEERVCKAFEEGLWFLDLDQLPESARPEFRGLIESVSIATGPDLKRRATLKKPMNAEQLEEMARRIICLLVQVIEVAR